MAQRFFNPAPQYFYSGTPAAPLSGGLMYFYQPGTTTPKDTYSDNGLSVPNTNPVVLTSSGVLPNVFLDGAYKVVLTDKDGVQQPGWPRDSVNSLTDIAFSAWDSTITYGLKAANIVYASDEQYYLSIQANNTNHDPSDQPAMAAWWVLLGDYLFSDQSLVANNTVAVGDTTLGLKGIAIDPGYVVVGDATNGIAGISMVTKGGILAGDGTTAPQVLAVGTNGQYLSAASGQTTGLQWVSPPAAITNIQEFSGSGTWTKPAGAVSVLIELWGGGGGGAGQAVGESGGGGGGGFTILLLAGAACAGTEPVTIGAGGGGGTASAGSDGGNTTFGALATARGGRGGNLSTSNAQSGDYTGQGATQEGQSSWASGAGAGTSGSTTGSAGGSCIMGGAGGGSADLTASGAGGTSLHGGNGGDGRTTAGTATAGAVPGGGGGGAYNGTGGAGAAGYARITAW
jgi:hypothetical protein